MVVKLYTINCPKCKVLERKLQQKGVEFETIDNTSDVVKYGESVGIVGAPILEVDGKAMAFNEAIAFVNSL